MAKESLAKRVARHEMSSGVRSALREFAAQTFELLPPDIPVAQFRAAVALEVEREKRIANADPLSVAQAMFDSATHGLLPGRDCVFVTFSSQSGAPKVQMIPKYQGLIRCLERTGKVAKVIAHPVYKGDHWEVDFLQDVFSHKPSFKSSQVVFYYAAIKMKDGTTHVRTMTKEDVDKVMNRVREYQKTPWTTHYEQMALKTVLKQTCKYAQVTHSVAQLVEYDDDAEHEDYNPEVGKQAVIDLFGKEPQRIERGKVVQIDAQVVDTQTGEVVSQDEPAGPVTDEEWETLMGDVEESDGRELF